MIYDMHVHTKFSADSKAEIEDYCIEAIEKGLNGICFTDHVDFNKNDRGYGYYKRREFFEEFSALKEKYKGKLDLLCGMEFSEPHMYQAELKEYSDYPYDFILGSVHFWYKDMCPSSLIREGVPVEVCYENYWDEVLATVSAGGFDALGHIDFPKRYYGKLISDADKIQKICATAVRKNICLEINTSSIRKNSMGTMPDKDILSVYKDAGGRFVTVGSDSHGAGDLAADFPYAQDLIKHFGFSEVIFRQRKIEILGKN